VLDPIAFVVVDPANRTPQKALEIRALVDSKVAYYKQLTGGVHFLDAIPKNPSGKILRRVLPKDVAKPPVSKAKM
jgi:4-coumarate--CoA ligase